jgi:two-component system CheB/CheR fusion protein
MQQVGIESPSDYVDYLEVHPEEFEPLFNTILINVTSFFRDADTWDALRGDVLPSIVARKPSRDIRVWSAGCASGQEAYSAVMVLAETIGADQVKERVKVYATDVDNHALEQARHAHYSNRELESVPAAWREKYFEPTPTGASFNGDLRRTVIFGRHDLLQDAPISRVDLLLCRNTLMYLNTDIQGLLVNRLHFSLADQGILVLGKVETLLARGELFQAVDARKRIFRKVSQGSIRSRLLSMNAGLVDGSAVDLANDRLVDVGFEHAALPTMLVDGDGTLVGVNHRARVMFAIASDVVGRPFQDLEISYRPVELRSAMDQARSDGRPVKLDARERYTSSGELTYLDVEVVPLNLDGRHLGMLVSFSDVTHHRRVQDELEHTHRELETTNEELQSTNEELETTNEELQSTIEELETTNEELQSTNEELETMNEELSSSNEELQAINDELRDRTTELSQMSAYMESILLSVHAAVIVVDRDLQIRLWNGLSFDMWGLRADEVEGRSVLGLDIGLPVGELAGPIRACLAGTLTDEPIFLDCTTRRGVHVRCRVKVTPLRGQSNATEGVILLIDQDR